MAYPVLRFIAQGSIPHLFSIPTSRWDLSLRPSKCGSPLWLSAVQPWRRRNAWLGNLVSRLSSKINLWFGNCQKKTQKNIKRLIEAPALTLRKLDIQPPKPQEVRKASSLMEHHQPMSKVMTFLHQLTLIAIRICEILNHQQPSTNQKIIQKTWFPNTTIWFIFALTYWNLPNLPCLLQLLQRQAGRHFSPWKWPTNEP